MGKTEKLGFVSVFMLIIVAVFAVSQYDVSLTGFIVAEDFGTDYTETDDGEKVFSDTRMIEFGPVNMDEYVDDGYLWSTEETYMIFEFRSDGTVVLTLELEEEKVDRQGSYIVEEDGENINMVFDEHEITFRPSLDEEGVYIYEDEKITLEGSISVI